MGNDHQDDIDGCSKEDADCDVYYHNDQAKDQSDNIIGDKGDDCESNGSGS